MLKSTPLTKKSSRPSSGAKRASVSGEYAAGVPVISTAQALKRLQRTRALLEVGALANSSRWALSASSIASTRSSTDITEPSSTKNASIDLSTTQPPQNECTVIMRLIHRVVAWNASPIASARASTPSSASTSFGSEAPFAKDGSSGGNAFITQQCFQTVPLKDSVGRIDIEFQGSTPFNYPSVCLLLSGEEQLQSLNYQDNFISRIENLHNLINLVFLDLYNNHIEKICGLECLVNLRVLMLGRNRIRLIENLDELVKLDLLDLHSNQITTIENIGKLSSLRVLNLEDNLIERIPTLTELVTIGELNLKKNKIKYIDTNSHLEHLRRLMLSDNKISTLNNVSAVFDIPNLTELTMEQNAVTELNKYRICIINRCKALKLLDGRRVLDEERRSALKIAKKDAERKREVDRKTSQVEERTKCIAHIKSMWDQNRLDSLAISDSAKHQTGSNSCRHQTSRYGDGVAALDRLNLDMITSAEFHMLLPIQLELLLKKLKDFTALTSLVFGPTGISQLKQLLPLASVKSLVSIDIDCQNPIVTMSVFRSYMISLLSDSIKTLCNVPVTKIERESARIQFGDLCEIIKQDTYRAATSIKPVEQQGARNYVRYLIDQGVESDQKLKMMNEIWQKLVLKTCANTIVQQDNPSRGIDALAHAVAEYMPPS
ncbi:hypothetical protein BATDEDRAFT_22283 [Batrachochytrium dendrobatidis JAM81]|uniref:Leucine-rich repeat-containing protein 49 n=1 Tax=Batrachochytrium dendrobatidis (strain JAM81 / FGSC 10211) TaxID=684364 RepID=F4NTJ6_BATDJ|nr:uncharacterized protein BATDEDRAFT_22283 [Batrachochytrium dendrobatidis JAM81]EGF84333.1 hypothetical protein BATDEDRAFT_22283 [Batrachochytrium dendrobatidis JAM81]|eukprot:XP_006675519.1 hypothetical protein BATDEDRAFT_22283 [Batrachochytrium dendrobatidis JAM81]